MIQKTYKQFGIRNKLILVNVHDTAQIVRFIPDGAFYLFTTADQELQKALEEHELFKVLFYLVCTVQKEENKDIKDLNDLNDFQTENKPKQVAGITVLAKAKAFLRENGVTIAQMATKTETIDIALKNGFEFPDLQ